MCFFITAKGGSGITSGSLMIRPLSGANKGTEAKRVHLTKSVGITLLARLKQHHTKARQNYICMTSLPAPSKSSSLHMSKYVPQTRQPLQLDRTLSRIVRLAASQN